MLIKWASGIQGPVLYDFGTVLAPLTVRNPLLLCPLVLDQDGGTRSRQKCLHRDFSATVLFWVIMLGEAIFDIKYDFLVAVVTADNI